MVVRSEGGNAPASARPRSENSDTSRCLTLVRHAMPLQIPGEDPSTWGLGPEGVAAARRLSDTLPDDPYVVASPEPKAVATALTGTGRQPTLDLRLVEVRRPADWVADHRTRALRYLRGEAQDGWEDRDDVMMRMDAAIQEHLDHAAGRRLVVVGHGMSAALWMSRRLRVDAAQWWMGLAFPDTWEVDLDAVDAHRLALPA